MKMATVTKVTLNITEPRKIQLLLILCIDKYYISASSDVSFEAF